jgi:CRP-like cAMP-binding protein
VTKYQLGGRVIVIGEDGATRELCGFLSSFGVEVTRIPRLGISLTSADTSSEQAVPIPVLTLAEGLRFPGGPAINANSRPGKIAPNPAYLQQGGHGFRPTTRGTARGASPGETRFPRGTAILLPGHVVGEILDGVVSLSAVHEDGAEALTALLGPGDFLLPHPRDDCHLAATAHTDVRLVSRALAEAVQGSEFGANLLSRLLRAEAWAAMQAHPFIERRITGILHLLSEQFGTETLAGCLIDVRLTHAQLAAAVGSTRATVSRVIGALVRRGEVAVIETGGGPRFYLPS